MEGVIFTVTGGELKSSGNNLRKLPHPTDLGESDIVQIKYMDLSYNKISTLDGLESYSSLETLILDCNCIGDDVGFPSCPSLTTISLNKNQIADLDCLLLKLKGMAPNLRFLSLLGNNACPHQLMGLDYDDSDYHRYRCYVIYCLPTLKFLDSTPVTRDEKEEAVLRGKYFRTVKPILFKNLTKSVWLDQKDFIPLPPAKLNFAFHKGNVTFYFDFNLFFKLLFSGIGLTYLVLSYGENKRLGIYGACRYKYTGKNSEGNRFIRNHDL